MRVFVAGATGVIGGQLLPMLISAGHQVSGLARSRRRAEEVERLGARIVVADALDAPALDAAVHSAAPEVVVHLLTAIPSTINPRRFAQDFEATNRLRTEGTRNLVKAARQVGARRMISQGVAFAYDPHGEGLANESTPLWQKPPRQFGPGLAALRELEQLTYDFGGLVLRFGNLYGTGTGFAPDGYVVSQVKAGKMPIVGKGSGTISFTHTYDAASAIATALEQDVSGVLNIVDDDPAPVREWLPYLANILDAPRPIRVPTVVARLMAGSWGAAYMTQTRGADNTRAKTVLGWRPRYASWRTGLAEELG